MSSEDVAAGATTRTLGIMGGMGPETTAEFYLGVLRRCRALYPTAYPRIIIDSVPIPYAAEEDLVLRGCNIEAYKPLVIESVTALERAGAELIALPCNTLHEYHKLLQEQVNVPVLDILDATARECLAAGYRRVAVVGTPRTIRTRLYEPALAKAGLDSIPLLPAEVSETGEIIFDLLSGRESAEHRSRILALMDSLSARGAEAVILGCTDLQLVVRPSDSDLPLPAVDSVEALVELTAQEMARPVD